MPSYQLLILHGPNLNHLGKRDPDVYSTKTLDDLNEEIQIFAKKHNFTVEIHQSNHEGILIDLIENAHKKSHGIIINPAGFTHSSVALRDAIEITPLPTIEVHLSNILAREDFRQKSLISPVSIGSICGLGYQSYLLGMQAMIDYLNDSV